MNTLEHAQFVRKPCTFIFRSRFSDSRACSWNCFLALHQQVPSDPQLGVGCVSHMDIRCFWLQHFGERLTCAAAERGKDTARSRDGNETRIERSWRTNIRLGATQKIRNHSSRHQSKEPDEHHDVCRTVQRNTA